MRIAGSEALSEAFKTPHGGEKMKAIITLLSLVFLLQFFTGCFKRFPQDRIDGPETYEVEMPGIQANGFQPDLSDSYPAPI